MCKCTLLGEYKGGIVSDVWVDARWEAGVENRKSYEYKSPGISKNSWKNFIFKGYIIGRIKAEVTKGVTDNSGL